ncbi:MAG TPA: trigger factor [Candidatus Scybalocola faecigallinarum]|uniref:Trigger factor n=1 Tax=Candidatus Scybalocola faecigallinarum TaxID=2840941 RepID=A0A9D1JRW2_9FIRM|nr:trigger factor [Candidatus Scybalocola faecigallinarum]
MSVQIEMLEKNMAKLTIEVPAEEFEKAITRAYNKNKGQISIPGFRKGKVPQIMVERMYGPAIFYEEAANYVMPEAYEKAAEESNLEIVSRPAIDVTQMEKGKDFIFTAEVAIKPEVTLGEYKGIEVEKTEITVTDEEVDAEIKKTQEQNSREITVERPAENGDTVVIDYAGTIDGAAFDGGSDKGHSLVLGSNSFIPGFEDQLVGATAGSDVEVHVTFPEDYHAKDLAGKEAVFACTVHEVKTKEYPEIDDEFAQDVSEFDTLAEYKEDIKKHITERKENEAKSAKQQKVMDKIIENATMEIPDAMVDTQAANMVDEYAQRLSYQGLSMDQYFQFTGLNAQTLKDQLKPQALKNIQSRLVLEAVIAAENIEVSDDEFNAEIEKMAAAYQMEADKVKELLGEEGAENIKKDLAAQKAVEFVADAAVEK